MYTIVYVNFAGRPVLRLQAPSESALDEARTQFDKARVDHLSRHR